MNFRICLFIATKSLADILIYLYIKLGSTDILTILSFLICEHELSHHLFVDSLISLIRDFSILYMNPIHILLDLCLSISLFWCYYKWKMKTFNYLLLACRRAIDL